MELKIDPALAGLTAGTIHHFTVQYPNQARLFTTLYAFALINAAFLILLLGSKDAIQSGVIGRLIKDFLMFDAVYYASALLFKIIYNVYFRHYGIPTKFWYAATDWVFWKKTQFGKPYLVIADLHRELGDVARIQPNHIVFNNINAIDDIYGHNTKTNKSEAYTATIGMSKYPPSIISELNKTRHGFLRRVISPSFGPTSLKSLELTMNRYYDDFLNGIEDRANKNGGIVEMNEWFHNLSFDISGALALGSDFGSLHAGETHFFIKAVHGSLRFMSLFTTISWLAPIMLLFPTPQFVKNTRERCQQFSRDAVLACLEREKSREEKNILGSLQRATDKETGAKLSFGELVINSHTLLIAGADTTAVSMTFGLYYIVAIPKVWDRLSREIRSRFDKIEDINGQSTGQLQFLDAVIHEILRIRPIASGTPPRVTPPEGMTIGGRFVRGNTVVSCPTWTLLHDERYFSNPHSFIPERWIESERGNETCVKEAWIPFSYGKWNCIGKPLAMMEMRVTLSRLIWSYDITLKSVGQEVPTYHHLSLASGPLEVRLTRVERNQS